MAQSFLSVHSIAADCVGIRTLTMNTLKSFVFLVLAFFALPIADGTAAAPLDVDAANASHGNVLYQVVESDTNGKSFRCGEA